MAFHRRPPWVQLVRHGTPELFVLRPLAGGFTPSNVGDSWPPPEQTDKVQMQQARRMYERRQVGTKEELDAALAKFGRPGPQQAETIAPDLMPKTRKEPGRRQVNG